MRTIQFPLVYENQSRLARISLVVMIETLNHLHLLKSYIFWGNW